ncbi:MAG: serine protease [Nitrospirae bacterium RIFCSPLOWO2_12_FULL_63_8]|nr:MAG: serine protease [Nitrospirae bacterium RIFCSPLOWO2_12_FULL_63_8]
MKVRNPHMRQRLLIWAVLASLLCFEPFFGISQAAEELSGLRLLEEIQSVLVALADRVKPAVVNIAPLSSASAKSGETPRGDRGPNNPGTGSGVIVDKEGLIVTNNHVVGDAKEVEVRLSDKSKFIGQVIGRDPDTDIAIVKITPTGELPTVPFGDSSKVRVGQWVMAVGNPFSLDRTVTLGVVSGLERDAVRLSRYEAFIQTDASINPGNSGGPLFNIKGEVIGINTAIINYAQGIGFAIPSNMVQQVTGQLRVRGKVTRGWLGVGIQEVTAELAGKFGIKENDGVLVNDVFENEPAARAGLKPGDIIAKVDGRRVETPAGLSRAVAGLTPGTKIELDVIRGGERRTITVDLGERKEDAVVASIPSPPPQPEVKLGLSVQDLTPELADKFKIKDQKGVLVNKVDPGSVAQEQGLREGDLIKEVNRQAVASAEEFKSAVAQAKKGESVLLRVVRENRAFYSVLSPKEK